jgi:SAM-dependent methyltransferase
MKVSAVRLQAEEERLKAAYARRLSHVSRDRYSVFSVSHLLRIQELERCLLALLREQNICHLESLRILEAGCGSGFWLSQFVSWGARPENVFGIDLLPEPIAKARRLCPAGVTIRLGNVCSLEMPDSSFDVVAAFTLFSSVLDPAVRTQVAGELSRVLASDGVILWYDLRVDNPANPDVRGLTKKDIQTLFPRCRIRLKRVTLVPPLARFLAPRVPFSYGLLSGVKLLCGHYAGLFHKTMAPR